MSAGADIRDPALSPPSSAPAAAPTWYAPAWRRRLTLFLAILISGGILIFPRLPLLLIVMVLCLAQRGFRLTFDRRMMPIAALLAVALLLNLLRPSGPDAASLVVRYANFIAGLMLLRVYLAAAPGSLTGDLAAILPWLAVQAILTVPLAVAVPQLFMTIDVNETLYSTMAGIFTHHATIEDAGFLPRPDGFFYEPGVLQIYLNLYLYIALYLKRRWPHSALAVLAVLATQSSTGMLITLLLLAGFGLRSSLTGSWFSRASRVVGLLLVLAPVAWVAQENINDKLFGESRGSAWARQYDLMTGINIIAANPVLGIGFSYERYIDEARQLGYADTELDDRIIDGRGNTNGIIFLIYSLGIPLALPFLVGMFRQGFFPNRLLVGMLLFLSLMSESIVFTPFFLMIIFSGLLAKSRRAVDRARGAG